MKEWTRDEDVALAGMKRAGLPSKLIAERLGRTVASVNQRCNKIKAYRRLDRKGGRCPPEKWIY